MAPDRRGAGDLLRHHARPARRPAGHCHIRHAPPGKSLPRSKFGVDMPENVVKLSPIRRAEAGMAAGKGNQTLTRVSQMMALLGGIVLMAVGGSLMSAPGSLFLLR